MRDEPIRTPGWLRKAGCVFGLIVFLVPVGYVATFFWASSNLSKQIERKLLELRSLPADHCEALSAACLSLFNTCEKGDVAPAAWPPSIAKLSPLSVAVGDDDVFLYFSGGHYRFVGLYWRPKEESKDSPANSKPILEVVSDGDHWILWPR